MKFMYFFLSMLLSALCSTAYASDLDMSTLMQLFASNKNIKTDFVERKFIRVLDAPVESSGELVFIVPAHLEKNTKLPKAEAMTIDGNKVSIERGSFKRTMSLDDLSNMASMVQSLTATFRGDQAGIEQYFTWALTGTLKKWQLVLKPKSIKLFITIREIRFKGEGDYIHTVETTLTDGDSSLMTLGRAVKVDSK
jgi:Outer membrane lipoprotein carrier protein LolA-like